MDKILGKWYKGECCAPGLNSESESEILTISQSIEGAEEETDYDFYIQQLEDIKKSLQQLRSKLVVTAPDPSEPEIPCPFEDTALLTPNQHLLLQLHRSNCVLRSQLRNQAMRLHAIRNEMKYVEAKRCQLANRLSKMSMQLDAFAKFQQKAIRHFGLCIERNEQIKNSKIYEADFTAAMRLLITQIDRKMCYLVPKHSHDYQHYEVAIEIMLLRYFLNMLFSNMVNDWNQCNHRVYLQSEWGCEPTKPRALPEAPWSFKDYHID